MASPDNERAPLTGLSASPSSWVSAALAGTVVVFSVGLINFNKWLLNPSRFPHAVPLVLFHMCFCTLFALLLLFLKPSLFPALTNQVNRAEFTLHSYATGFLPLATVFATSLILGNMAYIYLPVAFIQMIKESNIIWVYLLSLACAMEVFGWQQLKVICFALLSMSLTIRGQLEFNLTGFLIQLSAVLCESVRIVLQGILLQGRNLDPLSYVLLVSPPCGCLLLGALLTIACLPAGVAGEGVALPSVAALLHWAPWLVANAMLAFALNVSIALLIKRTSPMSYIMVQIIKDVVAVLIGVIVLGEKTTLLQSLGFTGQVVSVLVWSALKRAPQKFADAGLFSGLHSSLFEEAPEGGTSMALPQKEVLDPEKATCKA